MGVETVLERVFVVLVGYLDVTSECISWFCTTKKTKCLVWALIYSIGLENVGVNVSIFFSTAKKFECWTQTRILKVRMNESTSSRTLDQISGP